MATFDPNTFLEQFQSGGTPQASATQTQNNVAQVATAQYGSTPQEAAGISGQTTQAANTTDWAVDKPQTVSGQVEGLIAKESPLMQQAETRSLQKMNERGLVNSSMAVGAGQSALYDAALPIAQQDANTYANAGKFNADAKNQASQFNAAQKNTMTSQLLDTGFKGLIANQAAKNDAVKTDATLGLQASLANQDAGVKERLTAFDGAMKMAMQGADTEAKLQLQQLGDATKIQLANIEAQYKQSLETSAGMTRTYQTMIEQIAGIMAQKDMDAASKQTAINHLTTLYNGALKVQEQVSGLELGSLLNPADFGVPESAGAPAPAASPIMGGTFGWENPGGY
jgi:hypothetical protein